MSGLLSTSLSGLIAAQRSLETIQHNISNVNTEGYSRQRVELGTETEQLTGDGFVGRGVNVTNITRSYDQFINKQLTSSISAFGEMDHYHQLASRIDNITADPFMGIAPSMNRFFNALNEVANDPTSIPSRQVLLSEAGVLTENFNMMNFRFEEIRTQNNNDMRSMVDDINSLAKSIADLNVKIAENMGKGQGIRQPNDLLDKQDALLSKLAAIVNVSVVPQKDGTSSVFMGNGQALVLKGGVAEFTTLQSEFDPGRQGIGIKMSSGIQDVTSQITGGSLGGALRFRDEVLDPAQQKLGRVAVGLAMEINATHKNGFDLSGTAGLDVFKFSGVADVPVIPSSLNSGDAVVTADFQSGNPLAARSLDYSDYSLTYVNAGGVDYTLTRIRDNQVMNLTATDTVPATSFFTLSFAATQPASFDPTAFAMVTAISPGTFTPAVASGPADNPFTLQVDGLQIYTEAPSTGGTVTANELDAALNAFLTTGAGAGIYFKTGSFATNDLIVSKSGSASTLTISSNFTGTAGEFSGGLTTVSGSAVIPAGIDIRVDSTGGKSRSPGDKSVIRPTYNSAQRIGVNIDDPRKIAAATNVEIDPLTKLPVFPPSIIKGPMPSDNSNALLLADLGNKLTMLGGTGSFNDTYSQIVSGVGTLTRAAELGSSAQQALLNQAKDDRESLAGVNLDEEAANLIKFQQAYQASAQSISVVKSLFDTLISAVR